MQDLIHRISLSLSVFFQSWRVAEVYSSTHLQTNVRQKALVYRRVAQAEKLSRGDGDIGMCKRTK
jgi:hypothetical protein